jgi:hypothetical protein
LPEPVAVALDVDDLAVVQEAIEDGGSQGESLKMEWSHLVSSV